MLRTERFVIDSPLDVAAAAKALEALFATPAVGLDGRVRGNEVSLRSLRDEWGAYYPFRVTAELVPLDSGSRLVVPFVPRLHHVIGLLLFALLVGSGVLLGASSHWWSVPIGAALVTWVAYDFADHYRGDKGRIKTHLRAVLLGERDQSRCMQHP